MTPFADAALIGLRVFGLFPMRLIPTKILAVIALSATIGCDQRSSPLATKSEKTEPIQKSQSMSPLESAVLALKQQQPNVAQEHISRAMMENPEDSKTLQVAAEIAFANQNVDLAVDLIADASIANDYLDPLLVERATIGFLTVGRIYEAIDFLEEVVKKHPERHNDRRKLFDFLINVEEHHRAIPHGRVLVRARQFDRVLLFSLCTFEQRDMEGESMNTLFKRNPSDLRLQLASVRIKFDEGKWDGLRETLLAILKESPDNVAAQVLLGRVFAETGQFSRLSDWAKHLNPEIEQTWEYWSVVGDWAYADQRYEQAARAYWESSRRNIDIGDVLAKLARTLVILQTQGHAIDPSVIEAVNRRAEILGDFVQDKERFYKLGNRSCDVIVDIVDSLVRLGRLWEAEAWTAYGMTIPDEHIEQLKQKRKSVVSQLRKDLPWQVSASHPVVDMDLGFFPAPDISSTPRGLVTTGNEPFRPSKSPVLRNEAKNRGLGSATCTPAAKFTDRVIPLYAQMEAGGCAIDFDRDGWPDLYVASSSGNPAEQDSGPNHLYRNLNGVFADVTEHSATQDKGFAQGVTFGDVNEDGFSDLIVMNYGLNQLFLNNGDGTFTRRNDWFPANRTTTWSTSGAIADINGDGLSDFFCAKYCAGMDALHTKCLEAKGSNTEGPCWPTKFAAQHDAVFSGQPRGNFVSEAERWNLVPEKPGRGLGVVVGPLDDHDGLDIFVANDMSNNHFWTRSNQQDLSLNECAVLRGLAFDGRFRPQACMGIATSDFDFDGDIDLFVTNFEQEYNTFYQQTDSGIWTDRTEVYGLAQSSFWTLGFGAQAIDFDNDAQCEIAVTNGHVYLTPSPPATYEQRMHVIRKGSNSKYELTDFADTSGYIAQDHVGRAMWILDADRDGRNDLAITHQFTPIAMLMNHTPNDNHWIKLRLTGVKDARDAIGATVTLRQNEFQRTTSLMAGDGFFCANERVLHFGLHDGVDPKQSLEVEVRWPNGAIQNHSVNANRDFLLVQGKDAFEFSR